MSPVVGPPGDNTEPWVVAEISKNWRDGKSVAKTPLLAKQFETVIQYNHQRGYRLHSFQIHRFMPQPNLLNETLIAVFEKVTVIDVTPKEPT